MLLLLLLPLVLHFTLSFAFFFSFENCNGCNYNFTKCHQSVHENIGDREAGSECRRISTIPERTSTSIVCMSECMRAHARRVNVIKVVIKCEGGSEKEQGRVVGAQLFVFGINIVCVVILHSNKMLLTIHKIETGNICEHWPL